MSGIIEFTGGSSGVGGGTNGGGGMTPAQLQKLEDAATKTELDDLGKKKLGLLEGGTVMGGTVFAGRVQAMQAPVQPNDVVRLGDVSRRMPKLFLFRIRWDLVALDAGELANGARTFVLPISFLRDRGLKMGRFNAPHLMRMSVYADNGGGSGFYGTYQGSGFTGQPPYGYRADSYWSTLNAPQSGWGAGRFTMPARAADYLPAYDPNNADAVKLHSGLALACRWTGELYQGLRTFHVLEVWDDDFLAFDGANEPVGFPENPAFE